MAAKTPKTIKSDGERAALDLLRARAALIGDAKVAQHERDQAAEELTRRRDRYGDAYQAARNGGWTVDELAALGLVAPPTGDTGRRRRSSAPPADEGPVDSAQP